jgi:hypothetical protein
MSVFQLLYASGGSRTITSEDINDILLKSRTNNAALGITGLLLFADNMFIQVLEGEEREVRDLASRIKRDPRHRNFMELIELTSANRAFAQWQMGFKKLRTDQPEGKVIFQASRDALEGRISKADQGFMMDAVMAFAGRDFLAA